MTLLAQAFKSKTIWFSIALAVLSVMQGFIGLFNLTPQGQAAVGVAVAVAITVLRVVTTMPLSDK